MFVHHEASLGLICAVLAGLLFLLSFVLWWGPPPAAGYEAHRVRLIGAGLFFLTASSFFN